MMQPVAADRFDSSSLEQSLTELGLGRSGDILVAYSGGLDSTVLLHALLHLDSVDGGRISALHVNHGLAPEADAWERHCRSQCAAWGVQFRCHRIGFLVHTGHGTEAAARDARYGWFSGEMMHLSVLLTAHHLDDHVETVLAGLFRGSGPRGLAGIHPSRAFGGGRLLRPLLRFQRSAIDEYARGNGLSWIEDPMNKHTGFTRNHIRHRVLPLVREKWPAVDQVIARAGDNCRDASALLDEMAAADLETVERGRDGAFWWLSVPGLRRLNRRRLMNTLRYFFSGCGLGSPSRRHLQDVVDIMVMGEPGAACLLGWSDVSVRRYRDRLYLSQMHPRSAVYESVWKAGADGPIVADGRRLMAVEVDGDGIRKSICDALGVNVRRRSGGERCRTVGNGCSKTLKKLFQERGVPPWLRDGYPLLYVGDELAGIAGLCYCQPHAAAAGEIGLVFTLVDVDERESGQVLIP